MKLAREIPVVRDRAAEFASPDALHEAKLRESEAREIGLRFPSARSAASMQELRECLEILGLPGNSYREASALAGAAGAYQLDETLARQMRSLGIELGAEGEVPYTATLDFLSPERFRLAQSHVWSAQAIRVFFETNGLELAGWRLDAEAEYSLSIVLHAGGSELDAWRALDALDALECHRRTHFELWARRINS